MKQFFKHGVAIALVSITGLATAQGSYPSKPVHLVSPYSPGGSTSFVARAIGEKFQEVAGQPLVIEYKPGAASNVGGAFVARSAPDGYTLLIAASSLAINPILYKDMPYDPVKDLEAVVMLTRTPNVLAVHPSLPVNNVEELIAYARANPGKLNYGSSGNGATNHLAMELFKTMAKVDIQHVPFKGGSQAMTALLGNHVQVMFNPASTVAPQAETGRVRMIAVASDKRVDGLNVPTVSESGLPGFESSVWFGLFAPAGTPGPVVQKLNADINAILKNKDVDTVLRKNGIIPVGGTSEYLQKALTGDVAQWAQVIKTANVKID